MLDRLSRTEHPTLRSLLILQALALIAAGSLTLLDTHLFWNPLLFHSGDDWLYYTTAVRMLHGALPYRDFPLEYPPLAVIPFLIPLVLAGGHDVGFPTYCWLLLAENILLSTALVLVLASILRGITPRPTGTLTWCVVGIVILAPLLPWRYDLFPALLTTLGLRAVLKQRPGLAGLWLGFGVAAKLYPVVFLPVLLLCYGVQNDRRAGARLLAGCVAAVAASVLPFLATGPAFLSFLQYHQHRGIEMESLAAGGIFLAHLAWHVPVMVVFNYGAFHLVSPLGPILLEIIPWAAGLLLGATALWSWTQQRADVATGGAVRAETLAVSLTAMLLAFILTNKVFSPQYMIWFLPLAPLLPRRHLAPFGVACVLTIMLFPFALPFLTMGSLWAIWLLVLRNIVVVGLFVHLVSSESRASLSSRRPILPIIQIRKVPERLP